MSSHQGWQRSSPNHSAMAGLQPSNSLFSIARLAVGRYFYDGKPFHLSQWDLCQTFSYRGRQCFQAGISMQANGQNGLHYSTSLATLWYDGYEPCLQLPCEMEHGWPSLRLLTMEGNAQQNGVSWRRSQKRRNCISMKARHFKNAGEETWNCTFYHLYLRLLSSQITLSYLLSICLFVHPWVCTVRTPHVCILYMYTVPRRISAHLVKSGVIINLHGICTSFHPSITLQYITHTTTQTEPYPQHMNENCKRSMIHAPAKFGQRLEFIIPLFVAPLNKRSATEATTATHQARSADSSGTCLVASLCFTVYSMLSPKTRCFWLLLSVLMMTLCLFIYLVDEKNWNESSN